MTPAQALRELRHWRAMHFAIRVFEAKFGMRIRFRDVAIANMERLAKLLCVVMLCGQALAQEHRHPTEVITGTLGKFYETWMRPDSPGISCCNLQDCAPVRQVRQIGSRWEARRESDGAWLIIPPEKIEQGRDSPDGRSHMCSMGPNVFCFIVGQGG